jgi:hypothetical protein
MFSAIATSFFPLLPGGWAATGGGVIGEGILEKQDQPHRGDNAARNG